MTAPPDDTTVIAALRVERDAALSEKVTLAKELAEYGKHIERQAATLESLAALKVENEELRAAQAAGLEVLQAMAASPGDTQPVFDLIARQAAKLCDVPAAAVAMFDGVMLHLAAQSGLNPADTDVYPTQFPRPAGPDSIMGRAVFSRQVEQIEDFDAFPGYGIARAPGPWSGMAVPLLRNGTPLGVISVGRPAVGRYSNNQVTLLQTFAEQAVIAISSAKTYRALQARTSDLQETLEYQTATSDVLKVISRSSFDLHPVLDTLVPPIGEA